MARISTSDDPQQWLTRQLAALQASPLSSRCLVLEVIHQQTYLSPPACRPLLLLLALEKNDFDIRIHCTLMADTPARRDSIAHLPATPRAFADFAMAQAAPWLDLAQPLMLKPVFVEKPWGREVWYTGIEARGQSLIEAQGHSIPLPWLLSLFPSRLTGQASSGELVLLKVLDPLPDAVYGDLYFEMHDQKREAYLVTAVDPVAWPDGQGAIRLGFDQHKRRQYPSDQAFREAWLEAVDHYQTLRRQIDGQLDEWRLAEGFGLHQPVPVARLKHWQEQLPAAWREEELRLRHQMDSFSGLYPLRVGDVVRIPCRMPHALQHGVRTVEFQTPVYERKILSFAQKVLTQNDWDTRSVVDRVSLEAPEDLCLPVVVQGETSSALEEVAAFDDFVVQRLQVRAGGSYHLEANRHYLLLLLIKGEVGIQAAGWSRQLEPSTEGLHSACLIPPLAHRLQLTAGQQDLLLLVARPVVADQGGDCL